MLLRKDNKCPYSKPFTTLSKFLEHVFPSVPCSFGYTSRTGFCDKIITCGDKNPGKMRFENRLVAVKLTRIIPNQYLPKVNPWHKRKSRLLLVD
jgi:hypothetical protein